MSRNINVNPGNYKVAGRERQGEDINQEEQKQTYTTQQADGGSDVPPWEATRHTFVSAQPPEQAPAEEARKPKAKARASKPKPKPRASKLKPKPRASKPKAKSRASKVKRSAARKTTKKAKRSKKPMRAVKRSKRRR